MSTYWDLECVAHQARALDETWNHGDDALAAIWRLRHQFLAVLAAAGDAFDIETIELNRPWKPIPYSLRSFIRTHADCEGVQLVNEYGDREDADSRAKLPPKHCPTCSCEPR